MGFLDRRGNAHDRDGRFAEKPHGAASSSVINEPEHHRNDYGEDVLITRDAEGKLHSVDGEPAYDLETVGGGRIRHFYNHGKLHREGGPAKESFAKGGEADFQWWHDGKFQIGVARAADGTETKYTSENAGWPVHREPAR